MKILASEKLSQHKFKDNHGYLICTDCIMARTGKQTYTRDDCFGDGDMTEIEVDRPEKEVFDPKTLASFENVPITIEHPDNNVDSDNYSSLAVGYMRDIHKGMYQGQPVMLGTAVITDSEGIEKVESGELTNLSCGYDCDIEDDKNPKQTNIRGNHVALCEIPRAGITRIQDSIRETRNPKKRAFLDSLAKNHISYVEKDPNRFTFLTDDIGKAKRLARQIVGNNFLEDRDTLAIDFYKERNNKMNKNKTTYSWGIFGDGGYEEYGSDCNSVQEARLEAENRARRNNRVLGEGFNISVFADDNPTEAIVDEYIDEKGRIYRNGTEKEFGREEKDTFIKERNNKMKKDSQIQEIEKEERLNRRIYGRLWDRINDLAYGEFEKENPIENTKFASDRYWELIYNRDHWNFFLDWLEKKYPAEYAEYIRKTETMRNATPKRNNGEIYSNDIPEDFLESDKDKGSVVTEEEWNRIRSVKWALFIEFIGDFGSFSVSLEYPYTRFNDKEDALKIYDSINSFDEAKEYAIRHKEQFSFSSHTIDEGIELATEVKLEIYKEIEKMGRIEGGFEAQKTFTRIGYGVKDDIVRQGSKWANKGKEGTHGHFRTKKEAREQQKAMFARGYKADDSIVICADSYEEAVRKYKRRLRNRF